MVIHATILDEVFDNDVLKGYHNLTPGEPVLIPSGVSTYNYTVTMSGDYVTTYINRVTVEVIELFLTYYAEVPFTFPIPKPS